MLGYVAIGLPCGILSNSIGMNALQVFLMSALFYSGAGQFMIPNMWLAGSPMGAIIASVSLVNTRQMLYSAAFAPMCRTAKKRLSFLFAATVTDESYGVNAAKFAEGGWSVDRAALVNLFSQSAWTAACVVGVLVGNAIGLPRHRRLCHDLHLYLPFGDAGLEAGHGGGGRRGDGGRVRVQGRGTRRPRHPHRAGGVAAAMAFSKVSERAGAGRRGEQP